MQRQLIRTNSTYIYTINDDDAPISSLSLFTAWKDQGGGDVHVLQSGGVEYCHEGCCRRRSMASLYPTLVETKKKKRVVRASDMRFFVSSNRCARHRHRYVAGHWIYMRVE